VTVYYFDPRADIFVPLAQLLKTATGKDSYYLESSRNHALARWDWTPTNGNASAGPQNPGRFPQRSLDSIDFRADIACRAKTHGDAWLMVQQFMTGARQLKAAAVRLESWRVEESSDQAATLKNVVTITVMWRMPLLEVPLDAASTTEPVTITDAQLDTSAPEYGTDDGTLIAPLG